MKKLVVLVGALLLVSGISGCGGDPREQLIDRTINLMGEVKSNMDEIRSELKKVVDDRKKDGKSLTANDLTRAKAKADDLKLYGERGLLRLKEELDRYKDETTDEERAKFGEKYERRVRDGVDALSEQSRELDAVLVEVDELIRREPDERLRRDLENTMAVLRRSLKDGREPFELLSKQRGS